MLLFILVEILCLWYAGLFWFSVSLWSYALLVFAILSDPPTSNLGSLVQAIGQQPNKAAPTIGSDREVNIVLWKEQQQATKNLWGTFFTLQFIRFRIFKASALWADAFYKSKCPSVFVSVCPSVCLFTFEVPFNGLFATTSRSRMSNIFRDLESLGKSNGMKWSNIWTVLFGSGLKSPRKKKSQWIRDLWSNGVSLILAYL